MAYTDIDKPSDYFETKLYTGNGGTQSITSLDFAPSLCWIKNRTQAYNNSLFDIIRGVGVRLQSDDTPGDNAMSDGLTAFNSDGFSVGANSQVNKASQNIVSWNWKAGTSFTNDASSTGIGTIDSTGSASDTAGFSIVSFTGTESNGTIKHGLSQKPSMIIVKNRNIGSQWWVYHSSLGATKQLVLNKTDAEATVSVIWNDTAPTSSVFSVGTGNEVNGSGNTHIAYCFAEKQGYSKFGSYTGNGNANGTFVYTGFKPAFVIAKDTSAANNWRLFDNKRPEFNLVDKLLFPSLSDAETVNVSGAGAIDILSNGFKIRSSANGLNASGSTYIYMCFAEQPFVTSSGVPATAR
jgi:hypothetical protein